MTNVEPTTTRGEETRQRIVDSALRMFEEKGFEKTTMRAIASDAGVSLGNAYYYFSSKEALVQGFYQRLQLLHEEKAKAALDGRSALADRWLAMELAFLDVAEPFHQFAGKFFAIAAEPTSPLSPFSEESKQARQASTHIMRKVIEGSGAKGDKRLLEELPELMWLGHMGVVLFWVHDRSPGQQRTRLLVRRVAPLVERVVALSRLRPLRPALHQALDVLAELST